MKLTHQQIGRIQLTLGIIREMIDPHASSNKASRGYAYELYELWENHYDELNVMSDDLKNLYNTGSSIELKRD